MTAIHAHSLPGEDESRWEPSALHPARVAGRAAEFATVFGGDEGADHPVGRGALAGRFFFVMAQSSQEIESPAIPARFNRGPRRSVIQAAVRPDGRMIVTTSRDGWLMMTPPCTATHELIEAAKSRRSWQMNGCLSARLGLSLAPKRRHAVNKL